MKPEVPIGAEIIFPPGTLCDGYPITSAIVVSRLVSSEGWVLHCLNYRGDYGQWLPFILFEDSCWYQFKGKVLTREEALTHPSKEVREKLASRLE